MHLKIRENVLFLPYIHKIDGNLFGSNDESGISEQKRPDRFPMRTRMCSAWVKPSQLRGRHCQSLYGKVHAQYISQPGLSGSGCLMICCRVVFFGYDFLHEVFVHPAAFF